jgi:hypothetical protein
MSSLEGRDLLLPANVTYDYPEGAKKIPGNKKVLSISFNAENRQDIKLFSWEKLWKDMTAKDKNRYPKKKYYKDAIGERTATDKFNFHGTDINITYHMKTHHEEKTYRIYKVSISSDEAIYEKPVCKDILAFRRSLLNIYHQDTPSEREQNDPIVQKMTAMGYQFYQTDVQIQGSGTSFMKNWNRDKLWFSKSEFKEPGQYIFILHRRYQEADFGLKYIINNSSLKKYALDKYLKDAQEIVGPWTDSQTKGYILNKTTEEINLFPAIENLGSSNEVFELYRFYHSEFHDEGINDTTEMAYFTARISPDFKPKPKTKTWREMTIYDRFPSEAARKKAIPQLNKSINENLRLLTGVNYKEYIDGPTLTYSSDVNKAAKRLQTAVNYDLEKLERAKRNWMHIEDIARQFSCAKSADFRGVSEQFDATYRSLLAFRNAYNLSAYSLVAKRDDFGDAVINSINHLKKFPLLLRQLTAMYDNEIGKFGDCPLEE